MRKRKNQSHKKQQKMAKNEKEKESIPNKSKNEKLSEMKEIDLVG